MARMHQLIGLAALGVSIVGCVPQEKYTAIKMERDRYAEQLATAQSDLNGARAEADTLRRQIEAIMGSSGDKEAYLRNLAAENADLKARLDELNKRYADAIARGSDSVALPQPLTNELTAFAAANPDLVEFDAARGIVKFKSDVTFATGDAEVTPKAKEVIRRFAAILNSASAAQYELLVAGHTDNAPVVNPATKQKGHHNNWYLSAHRAISVGSELQANRVSPNRLGVVGYAEQRPVASNATEAGKAQNRRVEVLILPTTVRGTAVTTQTPAAAPAPRNNNQSLNKDTAVTPSEPALSK